MGFEVAEISGSMCANPRGGLGFPLAGIGGFLTRELYWQRRNSLLWLQKKGGVGNPRWKKQNRHEQWRCIFKWKTSRQNQNVEATDDSDRSEYEKPDRHLVGAGNACYRLPPRAQSKVTPGRYLQVIGVGISISSIYWWAVRWRKCPKVGEKKRQTNKN